MYKLFTDKKENFECKIELEGASLDDAVARLVVESKKLNLLFVWSRFTRHLRRVMSFTNFVRTSFQARCFSLSD